MNDKEKIEKILRGYKILESKLQNKVIKRGIIKFPFQGMDYSQPSCKTNKVSREIENYVAEKEETESDIEEINRIIMTINSSLQCLPEKEYRIITSKYFEDKPNKYIAAEEDVSERTVKNYTKKALKRLKKTDLPEIFPKFARFFPT